MCVGEVLLKQWKQGNTLFGKTRKRPLEIGVFFLCKLTTFIDFPITSKVVPLHTNNMLVDVLVDIFLYILLIIPGGPVAAVIIRK